MTCSFTGTNGTLAEEEKLLCMVGTGKGKAAGLSLSKAPSSTSKGQLLF